MPLSLKKIPSLLQGREFSIPRYHPGSRLGEHLCSGERRFKLFPKRISPARITVGFSVFLTNRAFLSGLTLIQIAAPEGFSTGLAAPHRTIFGFAASLKPAYSFPSLPFLSLNWRD